MNTTGEKMNTMNTDRLRYRRSSRARIDECCICGRRESPSGDMASIRHDGPAHEVWAFDTYGMSAVAYDARDRVEAWASGETPMPSPEEFNAERRGA